MVVNSQLGGLPETQEVINKKPSKFDNQTKVGDRQKPNPGRKGRRIAGSTRMMERIEQARRKRCERLTRSPTKKDGRKTENSNREKERTGAQSI